MTPRLMKVHDAAIYLGMSVTKLKSKNLPVRRDVGNVLFDRMDLDDYADNLPYEGKWENDDDDEPEPALPKFAEPEFAPTRIPGVSRSLAPETRGVYFCTAVTPPRRIWGQPGEPNFDAAVKELLGELRYTDTEHDEVRALNEWCVTAVKRVRGRSMERGIPFNLTVDAVQTVLEMQDNRCALTGSEFDFEFTDKHSRRPFAPSIDRLDTEKGYLVDNFRITTVIANLARQDFGDNIFFRMCAETSRNRSLLRNHINSG